MGAGTAKDNYVSYSTTNPLYYNSPSSEKRNYDSSTVIFGRHFYVSEIGKGEIAFYPAAGYRYGKGGGIEVLVIFVVHGHLLHIAPALHLEVIYILLK